MGTLRGDRGWVVEWRWLPTGVQAVTDWTRRTIMIDPRLTAAEARSVLAHEAEHVRRGPVPDLPVLDAREELLVEQAAARRLIPVDLLADAMAWAHNLPECADELRVDEQLLTCRLEHLHPAERAVLRRRLAHRRVSC